ncbi:GNAT family N-acetyltransferase [Edaphobacter aggregans]|uniref:GNAT family N-acetyltransferase n=1 Tax=Edaphobacter aggregans TaxID=570835 RepID=UPI00054F1820|nr:GNAT family N-acetyltransferase [Edaphobacter aggregans]
MADVDVRDASPEDAAAIAAIYRPYVLTSAATMEVEPPDEAEMARRLSDVRGRGLPYVVAEMAGEVIGYGYAAPFRPRAGYCYTVEDSIYLRGDAAGRGVGRRLLEAVIAGSREAGSRQMVAVIGGGNSASMAMHRAMGFAEVGVLREAGWKFDRAQDITLMQLALL